MLYFMLVPPKFIHTRGISVGKSLVYLQTTSSEAWGCVGPCAKRLHGEVLSEEKPRPHTQGPNTGSGLRHCSLTRSSSETVVVWICLLHHLVALLHYDIVQAVSSGNRPGSDGLRILTGHHSRIRPASSSIQVARSCRIVIQV